MGTANSQVTRLICSEDFLISPEVLKYIFFGMCVLFLLHHHDLLLLLLFISGSIHPLPHTPSWRSA
jgi:hypothetical protein